MAVRLLDVQAEGAVVCRTSQVGTVGAAGTDTHTHTRHQEMLLIPKEQLEQLMGVKGCSREAGFILRKPRKN